MESISQDRPVFHSVALCLVCDTNSTETLASLGRQTYPAYKVHLVLALSGGSLSAKVRRHVPIIEKSRVAQMIELIDSAGYASQTFLRAENSVSGRLAASVA